MTRYVKRPETIEAWRFDGTPTYGGPMRLNGMPWAATGEVTYLGGRAFVGTPTGTVHATAGDWIVRDQRGDLSVMDDDTFTKTFTPEQETTT
jgi:hypothetical protein